MDLVITLDRDCAVPLYQQLAEELRKAILNGRLKPNYKLPSSRALAMSMEISRATVTQSYEQLLSEGYLETRYGSGTFVCSKLPEDYLHTELTDQYTPKPSELTMLSRFGVDL